MRNFEHDAVARTRDLLAAGRARVGAPIALAVVCLIAVASAHAAPTIDSLFGANGIARVGASSGAEDYADAAARLPDGRIVIAGRSLGRVSYSYVLRLTSSGQLDPTFGQGGVALLGPGLVLANIRQVAVLADGAVLVGGYDADSAFVVRLTASGTPDLSFGTNGIARKTASTVDTVWFVRQPDAGLLLVTAVDNQPTLRIARLDANGALDAAFGERTITAPGDYYPSPLPLAEDGEGGFVAVMNAFIREADGSIVFYPSSPFALLRVMPDGTLAAAYGTGGVVRNADLGIPFGRVRDIERGANGTWLVATSTTADPQSVGTPLLLRLHDDGSIDGGFDTGGRFELPTDLLARLSVNVVPLSGGGALVAGSGGSPQATIVKIGDTGALDATYGQAGVATVTASGYQWFSFTAGFVDAAGTARFVATLSKMVTCMTACFESGRDVGAIALDANGRLSAGYGRGDGVALFDRAESSTDTVDSLYTLPSGAVVVAGTSSANGAFKLLVARFTSEGKADDSFGTTGRVLLNPTARCYGPVQAAGEPGGRIAVAVGATTGGLCSVGAGQSFRLAADGVPMNTVPPSPKPAAGLPAASTLKIARPCEVSVATISAPSGTSVSDTLLVKPVVGIGNATRPLVPNSASGEPSGSA